MKFVNNRNSTGKFWNEQGSGTSGVLLPAKSVMGSAVCFLLCPPSSDDVSSLSNSRGSSKMPFFQSELELSKSAPEYTISFSSHSQCLHVCMCMYAFVCVRAWLCECAYVCAQINQSFTISDRTSVIYMDM